MLPTFRRFDCKVFLNDALVVDPVVSFSHTPDFLLSEQERAFGNYEGSDCAGVPWADFLA
ncbi:MAG TPA: hypothetical protein VN924_10015 [Bryobacteraceae bacterium]|nr:hypothetical protein [Bryobacteraceae bacterium]